MNQPRIDRVDLTTDERVFVENALSVWGGPANHRALPYGALGFAGGWPDFDAETMRLGSAVLRRQPLPEDREWARVLFFTELAFGSDIFGAGVEYYLTRALSDQDGIVALRSIQRKLRPYRDRLAPLVFVGLPASTADAELDETGPTTAPAALALDERRFIVAALEVWDGVARNQPVPTRELGFSSRDHFLGETQRLGRATAHEDIMSLLECRRVLFFTELAFSSDLFGAGADFAVATGISDADGIAILRRVQRKLLKGGPAQLFVRHT